MTIFFTTVPTEQEFQFGCYFFSKVKIKVKKMISLIQAGIAVNFVGFFLDLIGTVTNYWLKSGLQHAGLFRICKGSVCFAVKFTGGYKSMQFLACLGFILLLIVTIMAAVYLCKESVRENLHYRRSLGVLMIIGGLAAFIGAMIGVGAGNFKAGWSLGVAATGGIISFVAGILTLIPVNTVTVN